MAEAHNEPSDKIYLAIAASLAGLTAISYVGDLMHMPRRALICLVLAVAVVKATLVATFFMHLKWDWAKVRVMLIPALILAAVLVSALLPDITFAPREKVGKPAAASSAAGAHPPAAAHAP
jgi:cytochrome c oxidase subunit IV